MISDMFAAIIVILMAVLVIYPASRFIWQSWTERRPRRGRGHDAMRGP